MKQGNPWKVPVIRILVIVDVWRFGIDGVPDPKEIDRPVILAALSCLHLHRDDSHA